MSWYRVPEHRFRPADPLAPDFYARLLAAVGAYARAYTRLSPRTVRPRLTHLTGHRRRRSR